MHQNKSEFCNQYIRIKKEANLLGGGWKGCAWEGQI
jgi:hypothetical protein